MIWAVEKGWDGCDWFVRCSPVRDHRSPGACRCAWFDTHAEAIAYADRQARQ